MKNKSLIGRKALVTHVSDGLGYLSNDNKYTGKTYNLIRGEK